MFRKWKTFKSSLNLAMRNSPETEKGWGGGGGFSTGAMCPMSQENEQSRGQKTMCVN